MKTSANGFAMTLNWFPKYKKSLYLIFTICMLMHTRVMASPVAMDNNAASNKKDVQIESSTSVNSQSNASVGANSSILEQIETLRKNDNLYAAKLLAIEHLKKYPDDVDVLLLLGLIAYQQSDYVLAEFYFNKVLKLTPTYLDAKIGLIRVKMAQKHYQVASSLIKQVVKQAPDDPAVKEIQDFYKKARYKKTSSKDNAKPTTFITIQNLIKNKELTSAKSSAIEHLKKHPDDMDIVLLLGSIEYQQSDYAQAEIYFRKVLKKVPTYLDAKLGLIRVKLALKQYQTASELIKQAVRQAPDNTEVKEVQASYKMALKAEEEEVHRKAQQAKLMHQIFLIDQEIAKGHLLSAMTMINEQLLMRPNDPIFLMKKADIFFIKRLYSQSAYYGKQVLITHPTNNAAKELLSNINEISPHRLYGLNTIGLSTFNQYAADITQIWDYSTLYYARETPVGLVTARLNYAARLGERAPQGQLEFLPVLNPYLYFDLVGAIANKPQLFPQYSFLAEGYWTIPNFLTLSFGGNYNYIIGPTYFTKYTSSISKSLKDYWLSFRVNHYVPSAGQNSTLYIATIRRYFNTIDSYLNLTIGYGKSPDLADLEQVDFIVIQNRFANINFRFPIFNHQTLIDFGVDYANWKYPSGLVRNLYGINIGLNYKF